MEYVCRRGFKDYLCEFDIVNGNKKRDRSMIDLYREELL